MGLDMHLNARKSCYPKKGHRVIDLDHLSHDFNDCDSDRFGCSNSISIEENVCYWRKANAVHGWFVKNCQGGRDECQQSDVSEEQLHELYDICKGILEKVNGVEMVLDPKAKEFWDQQNEEAKKNGEKPKYPYKATLNFDKDNLEDMWNANLWSYTFKDEDKSIEDYCKDVLPPSEGFFFGQYGIDGGYIQDIVKTVLMLDRLFEKMKVWEEQKIWVGLTYQASW